MKWEGLLLDIKLHQRQGWCNFFTDILTSLKIVQLVVAGKASIHGVAISTSAEECGWPCRAALSYGEVRNTCSRKQSNTKCLSYSFCNNEFLGTVSFRSNKANNS